MNLPGDIWFAAAWPPGWTVLHVTETGSTNDDLLAAVATETVGERTALATDHQTAGRGRLDRRWDAPPGTNLLVSIVLPARRARPAEPTQRVAVAACRAVDRLVPGMAVGVKWPNDLLVGDRKLAGILAHQAGPHAVVGLGLNVAWSPAGAADLGGAVAPAAVLAALLAELDALPPEVGPLHRDRLVTLGRRVRATLPGGTEVVGRAEDVDAAGCLLVVDRDGRHHRLDAGDVVHLRDH